MTYWLITLALLSAALLTTLIPVSLRLRRQTHKLALYESRRIDWLDAMDKVDELRSERRDQDEELERLRQEERALRLEISTLQQELSRRPTFGAEQLQELLNLVLDAGDEFTSASHAFSTLLVNAQDLLDSSDKLNDAIKGKLAEIGADDNGEVLTIRLPNDSSAFLGALAQLPYLQARGFWIERHPDKVQQFGMPWFTDLHNVLFARAIRHLDTLRARKSHR